MFSKNIAFRANKIFVDRVDPTDLAIQICEKIQKDKDKELLVFYGFGGIGKTRLLSELCAMCNKIKGINAFKIGLNTYEYNSIISILLAIRQQIDLDMPVFDYAVVQYYNKSGLPLNNLKEKYKNVRSSLIDGMVKVAKECANIFIPFFPFIQKFADIAPEVKTIYQHLKNRAWFSQIEEMDANTLQKNLPLLLSDYINNGKKTTVIMFDDYESMRNKLDKCAVCDDCDDWIINLFKHIDSCLFVFSSREKLNWENKPAVAPYLRQYMVGKLSDEDARTFLSSVPINDESLIGNIVNIASGIPLCLDMCVDLYSDYVCGHTPSLDLNDVDTGTITERYLKHFSENQHNAVKYLSLLDVFDIDLARYLLRSLNVGLDEMQLNNLLSKCLFELMDDGSTYKLDSSIKEHLSLIKNEIMATDVAYMLMDYIELSAQNARLLNITKYYENLLKIIESLGLGLGALHINKLFRCTVMMIDLGYWSDLEKMASHYLQEEKTLAYHPLKKYITCQYLKRTGDLSAAKDLAQSLLLEKTKLGIYEYSAELLYTQIIHLLGHYDDAIERYTKIIANMELFDLNTKDERTYTLSKLKFSDLLFLKGKFQSSLENLKTINIPTNNSSDLEVEFRRIKAHIYRFNFSFETSTKLYEFALQNYAKDYKARGSLLNNLAESTAFGHPRLSVEFGKKSLEYNAAINAALECGKTYAALSIAYSQLAMFDEAEKHLVLAFNSPQTTGYRAGLMFALLAKIVYLKRKGGQKKELFAAFEEMERVYQEVKVYQYLVVYAGILCDVCYDDGESIEWLDKNNTLETIKKLIT